MAELKTHTQREQRVSDETSGARGSQSERDTEGGLLDQARGIASSVAEQAKSAVGGRLTERTTKSAVELSEVADALRHTSRRLEGNVVGPLIGKAAERVEQISDALDRTDLRQVVRDVENFARREPVLFLGGAFAAGLLGARFLRGAAPSPSEIMEAQREARKPAPSGSRAASPGESRRLSS
jgi:hypothetical protein